MNHQLRPVFTVAIPTLDRGRRALEAVRHALAADNTPGLFEVLVLDNASTIDAACYREIAAISDSRLRYIKRETMQPYQGQILELLEMARGENLLYLSDEDTLDISMLKALAAQQQREPCAVRYLKNEDIGESDVPELGFLYCYYLSTFVLDISDTAAVREVLRLIPRGEENYLNYIYTHKVIAFLMQLISPRPVAYFTGMLNKMGVEEVQDQEAQTIREEKQKKLKDAKGTNVYYTRESRIEQILNWISLFRQFHGLLAARYTPVESANILSEGLRHGLATAATATLLEPEPLKGLRCLVQEVEPVFSAAAALAQQYDSFKNWDAAGVKRDFCYQVQYMKNHVNRALSWIPTMQKGLHPGYPLVFYGAGYMGRALYQYRHLLDREIFCFCDRDGLGAAPLSNSPLLAIRPATLKTLPTPFDTVITTTSNPIAVSIKNDLEAIGITENITAPFLAYRRVVITGGTGIIGRALVDCLLKKKIEVLLLLRNAESRRHTFPDSPLLTLMECSLENLSTCQGDGTHWDAFFHLGWSNTHRAARDDKALQEENVGYTLEAVRLAKRLGCHSFIGAGSQAEYGPVDGAITEETPPAPITAYGGAKLRAGNESRSLCGELGLRHCWARIFSVYGPHDRPDAMLPTAIRRLLAGEEMAFTPLTQPWNYLYSEDAALALTFVAEYGEYGAVYNVANSENRPLSEYVEVLFSAFDQQPRGIGVLPYPPDSAKGLQADDTKAFVETGFQAKMSFEKGIAATIQWHRENEINKLEE